MPPPLPPPPAMAEVLASAGLVPGLPVDQIHDRLRQGLTLHDAGQRMLAFYLHEIDAGQLYQVGGYANTVQFAEQRLELDRRRTRELINVGRKLRTLPRIDYAFCRREVSWTKVLLLMGVVTPEHEDAWLVRAQELPCRELLLDIRAARPGGPPPARGERKGTPEVRFRIEASVGSLTREKLELAKKQLSAECGRTLDEAEFLDHLAEMVLQTAPDGSIPGRKPVDSSLYRIVLHPDETLQGLGAGGLCVDSEDGLLPVARAAGILCDAEVIHVHDEEGVSKDGDVPHAHDPSSGGGDPDPKTPAWLRRKVLARDGHRCRCCGSRRRLHAHHIRLRSHLGPTKARNLVSLCDHCHALVHDGLIVIVGERAEEIRFLDREGRPLGESDYRAGRLAPLPLEVPPAAPPPPPVTSLATVPEVVDGDWWRRHAHLVRFAGGSLQFEEGARVPAAAPGGAPAPDVRRAFDRGEMREAFSGILGQALLVDRLEIAAQGSEALGRPFPHTLLTGPAGTGKTTIAQAIATATGRRLVKATGPLLQDVPQLVRVLADVRPGDVLFLEEVHAVPRPVLEALYEAMAERRVSLTLQAGSRAKAVRLDLPAFTVIAATTEEGDLPVPFLSRFGLRESLAPYAADVLADLVRGEAKKAKVDLDAGGAGRLASFARGTPREALRLLDRVLEAAGSEGVRRVGEREVARYLTRLGYDQRGLNLLEQRYLGLLQRSPGPISLVRMAHMLGAGIRALHRDVEPYLLLRGFIEVTPRGRVALRHPRPLVA